MKSKEKSFFAHVDRVLTESKPESSFVVRECFDKIGHEMYENSQLENEARVFSFRI
jgi:hypothetical protein